MIVCISRYRNDDAGILVLPGEGLDLGPGAEDWLRRDSAKSFEDAPTDFAGLVPDMSEMADRIKEAKASGRGGGESMTSSNTALTRGGLA